jgi:aspartate/methionine/tyrosine aminotransferase
MIADTYLSVNTPAQCALPELLHLAPAIRRQIHARTAGNRRWLQGQRNPLSSWDLVPAEGGWYAVLRVPRIMTEERWCLALATEDRLLVHPGYFFDFDTEAFLVVSTLLPEADFRDALGRLIRRIDAVR